VSIRLRSPVEKIRFDGRSVSGVKAGGEEYTADYYICALPIGKGSRGGAELGLDLRAFRHSPITGIHLWFDRPVTDSSRPRCSTAPYNGSSTSPAGGTCNSSSARPARSSP